MGLKDMKVVNCTPHAITVIKEEGSVTFEPSGVIPRVASNQVEIEPGFWRSEMGDVTGLPEQEEGTLLIVSAMVQAASDRKDLIAPATGQAIRNEAGHIIGVPGFIVK